MVTVLEIREGDKVRTIRPVSADSHVTEPPNCYIDHIDPRFRDRAPKVIPDERRGFVFEIDGLQGGIGLGTIAAAGKKPSEIRKDGTFADLHPGGWDPKARIADQDRDGVVAEIVYPSVGMVLCGHEDADYKHACMKAYNRWLQQFCAGAPGRLFGAGQTALRSVGEAVEDLREIREMGFKTAMLPLWPCTGFDFDDERWDPFWRASVELDLPLSFHISSGGNKKDKAGNFVAGRGPSLGVWIGVIRSVQDIAGMLIFSGVFDRFPDLKVVLVEGDAGWLPHMSYRMDHAYKQHRFWMKGKELQHLPSEYWENHFKLTYQDDKTAWQMVAAGLLSPKMLMWANDFPHSDATWPHSMEILADQAGGVSPEARRQILETNCTDLYKITL
ncbi:Predicted metal-dependent hydrolase, TIM-barrel fold [Sphingobium faniae]|nr:Predicted metal-dependent hydrolase, TIM-barrel fold [Sphingobium faniae]